MSWPTPPPSSPTRRQCPPERGTAAMLQAFLDIARGHLELDAPPSTTSSRHCAPTIVSPPSPMASSSAPSIRPRVSNGQSFISSALRTVMFRSDSLRAPTPAPRAAPPLRRRHPRQARAPCLLERRTRDRRPTRRTRTSPWIEASPRRARSSPDERPSIATYGRRSLPSPRSISRSPISTNARSCVISCSSGAKHWAEKAHVSPTAVLSDRAVEPS